MIEVGKKYLIKTKIKKSVTQIEFFENSSGKTIFYDTVYRSGEFMVMPGDEDEVKYLQKFHLLMLYLHLLLGLIYYISLLLVHYIH